jgi:hypothetical protein
MNGGISPVGLNILFPNVASCADLGCCYIRCCWCPPGGVWCFPKCWCIGCWRSNVGVGNIRNDEAQVSSGSSAQVSVDCSQVCLEKLSGSVDGLITRLALYCWKDGVGGACHDVLNGGVPHLDAGRTGVPVCFARKNIFGPEAKENGSLARGL